jgi:heat shock protein HslJ
VNRLQVSVRTGSVGLLLAGVAGGVYLGQDRDALQQSADVNLVVQAETAERDLLIERQAQHAAARAPQRKAEADAAAKASRAAKAAASRARKLEKAALKKKAQAAAAKAESSGGGATKPYTGPIPASCNEYSGNRKIGCALLLDKGFKIAEMPCLDKLWDKESGWNHKARNASSGAYGIAQALPGSKMASAGADWKTSPATQIKWGLGYIKDRYKTPCAAWAHSESVGWY